MAFLRAQTWASSHSSCFYSCYPSPGSGNSLLRLTSDVFLADLFLCRPVLGHHFPEGSVLGSVSPLLIGSLWFFFRGYSAPCVRFPLNQILHSKESVCCPYRELCEPSGLSLFHGLGMSLLLLFSHLCIPVSPQTRFFHNIFLSLPLKGCNHIRTHSASRSRSLCLTCLVHPFTTAFLESPSESTEYRRQIPP